MLRHKSVVQSLRAEQRALKVKKTAIQENVTYCNSTGSSVRTVLKISRDKDALRRLADTSIFYYDPKEAEHLLAAIASDGLEDPTGATPNTQWRENLYVLYKQESGGYGAPSYGAPSLPVFAMWAMQVHTDPARADADRAARRMASLEVALAEANAALAFAAKMGLKSREIEWRRKHTAAISAAVAAT